MNRLEFMAKLREALAGLPDEERANALRYYEEYFDEAENEEKAAAGLGDPQHVAQQILQEYRDLTTVPLMANASGASGVSGTSSGCGTAGMANPLPQKRPAWMWAALIILGIAALPVLLLVLGVLITVVVSTAFSAIVVVGTVFLTVMILAVVLPFVALLCGGVAVATSFLIWSTPADAILTLGCGLAALGGGILGLLLLRLLLKLCGKILPPLVRGFVALLRRPFVWLGKKLNRKGQE